MAAPTLARNDHTIIGQWWWTIDRRMLLAVFALAVIGFIMLLAASPTTARRIDVDASFFIIRQVMILPVALAVMLGLSMLTPVWVRRIGTLMLLAVLLLLVATVFIGTETKGARRWINLAGFSLQASEFLKPALAIAAAWMFAAWRGKLGIAGLCMAVTLYLTSLILLLLQPDIGMASVITVVWGAQFFIAGMPVWLVIGVLGLIPVAALGAYHSFYHVRSRVDRFLNPETGDNYQIDQSLRAIDNGGLFGVGPGEGQIKYYIPDAHADFVFAVAAEEFGLIACAIIVGLFLYVFIRGAKHMRQENNLFVILATVGLLVQWAAQAFVNIASSIALIPPKGMTLPFISYGGSSLLAIAISTGFLLALTRKRPT